MLHSFVRLNSKPKVDTMQCRLISTLLNNSISSGDLTMFVPVQCCTVSFYYINSNQNSLWSFSATQNFIKQVSWQNVRHFLTWTNIIKQRHDISCGHRSSRATPSIELFRQAGLEKSCNWRPRARERAQIIVINWIHTPSDYTPFPAHVQQHTTSLPSL